MQKFPIFLTFGSIHIGQHLQKNPLQDKNK